MLAYAVHLGNRRAGSKELAVDVLFVGKSEAGCGGGEQCRPTARDKAEHEIVTGETLHQLADSECRIAPPFIRDRVSRLNNLNVPAGPAMAVAGDDKAAEWSRPVRF